MGAVAVESVGMFADGGRAVNGWPDHQQRRNRRIR
jgi:hypothetical protein